ncbi:hypothetical protein [Aquimarina sp. MMG016]|uniref:hypothetical protein n=1 Tax=Aquimarina sp. MMG016 TaxID=2822690 RepID=UPI001B3A2DEB|nr:hypothetical protein [Aquimarina sp. MMG016]MBQ4818611.1 hypothetical protein [Aquimarina sp. MMG016]
MRKILILTFIVLCNCSYGQVAIIKDKDGYTNVRKEPNINSKVIYKLKDSEVFIYEDSDTAENSNWIAVNIFKNKFSIESGNDQLLLGYIHKSRLYPLEKLKAYNGNRFSFSYKLQKFDFENKITNYDGKYVTKINGRRFYGTDGNIPKIQVSQINASVDGKNINIPDVLFEDIFECDNDFVINKNKEDYIIHQWNSDGAGGYLIVWVLDKNKVKQRLIFIP